MNPNITVINPIRIEEQEDKIRIAAYCRVSTDSEDQQNSLMTQMRYYENFLADSETERLVSVYADEGITGTRMDKREEFQRMLKDCRRGKIDRIIVKSINHSAPFGYELYNGNLIINQREAEIVKSIYKMFLSGMGYDSICRELNESKVIKNDKGTKWFPTSIQYILTNEKYIGDSLWQKNYNTSMPYKKVRNKGELEKFYYSKTHEPIISRTDFEADQKIYKSPGFRN